MTDEEINDGMEKLLAMNVGLTAIVASLIATHTRYDQFQIHLAGTLEVSLNTLGGHLSPQGRDIARGVVESLQSIAEVRGELNPLGQALTSRQHGDGKQ